MPLARHIHEPDEDHILCLDCGQPLMPAWHFDDERPDELENDNDPS